MTRFRFFALCLPFFSLADARRRGLHFRLASLARRQFFPLEICRAQFLLPMFFIRSRSLCAVGMCGSCFFSVTICVCNRIRKPVLSWCKICWPLRSAPRFFGKISSLVHAVKRRLRFDNSYFAEICRKLISLALLFRVILCRVSV
jgi:hypothetical protein